MTTEGTAPALFERISERVLDALAREEIESYRVPRRSGAQFHLRVNLLYPRRAVTVVSAGDDAVLIHKHGEAGMLPGAQRFESYEEALGALGLRP